MFQLYFIPQFHTLGDIYPYLSLHFCPHHFVFILFVMFSPHSFRLEHETIIFLCIFQITRYW